MRTEVDSVFRVVQVGMGVRMGWLPMARRCLDWIT